MRNTTIRRSSGTVTQPLATNGGARSAGRHASRFAVAVLAIFIAALAAHAPAMAASNFDFPNIVAYQRDSDSFPLISQRHAAPIVVDNADYAGVRRAAADLQADIERVSGVRPELVTGQPSGDVVILAGTLGHSALVNGLVQSGKLDAAAIRGKWESFIIASVANPLPGVRQALVIVGSDRRGTIYGLYEISQQIGVSPWYWWADVPPQHHEQLFIKPGTFVQGPPGVKYRGIFINDEDWGLNPWAKLTFDPQFKNIGPKTYAKLFELLLRLRLNYIWPAMHACSTEFGSVPENVALADEYGIVAGSSHCEPMLFNNVHWDQKTKGAWNYSTNQDAIHQCWEDNVKARSSEEAVWTLGIRGIHDAPMETPPKDMPSKIRLMSEIFHDQRDLLNQFVSKSWGPVAQCFVPYKEVLSIYDAGLRVPDDVTLVWVDDNFGYIRRLSSEQERKRSGGAGIYWHFSYYGGPHSYTWINTTAPALTWEELHKAWENDTRNLWVVNVGDIKPMEIGIDYYSRLAWNPDAMGPDSQPRFLHDWAAQTFSDQAAQPIADLLASYYQLGTIHKPELMDRAWAMSLSAERAQELSREYQQLLDNDQKILATIAPDARDAYTETAGFPARVLGMAGLIFMADRQVQFAQDVPGNEKKIAQLRADLEQQVRQFNTQVAGGKWNHIMPGLETGKPLNKWSSQVRWPWGEKETAAAAVHESNQPEAKWRDAATADRQNSAHDARWTEIAGLGPSGRAMALEPATPASTWAPTDPNSPALEFDFSTGGGNAQASIDFLPTFRLYPGMKLRVAVAVDDRQPTIVEVPGSEGTEDERGNVRSQAVQDNYTRAIVPLPTLSAGKHVLKISDVDPGAVIDRVALP